MDFTRRLTFHSVVPPALAVAALFAGSFILLPSCNAAEGNCDIAVGDGPSGVYGTGTTVYVTNQNADTVSVINASTNAVTTTISVGDTPVAIDGTGTGVYVLNQGGDSVSVIDTTTNTVEKTVSVGDQPFAIAISGTGAYIANLNGDTVSVIDTRTNTVAKTVSVGTAPRAFAVSGTGVYVLNGGSNNISVIDSSQDVVEKTVSVGGLPVAGAASGTGVFIANNGTSNVSFIDIRTNTVVGTVSVGNQPGAIAVRGNRLYTGNTGNDTISVITIASRTVTTTINGVDYPREMAVSGTGVYVSLYDEDQVAVVDTDTDTIVKIAAGDQPQHIAFAGTNGYVANSGDDDVSVFSIVTNRALSQCTPVCGNGQIGDGEQCDDGNTVNGDGCSSSCTVEEGWTLCRGEPSVCAQECSIGLAVGAETSKKYDSVCYAYYNPSGGKDYASAALTCEGLGGTLATVKSAEVQTVISSIGSFAWIGLSDIATEGTYIWADGTPLVYDNWAGGQPDGGSEDCVRTENAHLWHDYPCENAYSFYCAFADASSVSSSSETQTQSTGGIRKETLQNRMEQAGFGSTRYNVSEPRSSSLPSSGMSYVTKEVVSSSFRERVCQRVMKWFAGNDSILTRVNTRLLNRFDFMCSTSA